MKGPVRVNFRDHGSANEALLYPPIPVRFFFVFGITLKMADMTTIEAALKNTLQSFGISYLKRDRDGY